MITASKDVVRITVSEDGLQAHLLLAGDAPDELTPERLQAAVEGAGIPLTDELTASIDEVCAAIPTAGVPAEPILIAEGRPAVPGEPARISLLPGCTESDHESAEARDERTDFYQSQIVTVNEGDVVGKLAPAVPAVTGVDVLGRPIRAPEGADPMLLAEGVRLDGDGETIIANVAGKVWISKNVVSVIPAVEIRGDIDFSTGHVNATIDVIVRGTVRETFRLRSAKSVTVRGAIEGADVQAGAFLHVGGGIAGQGRARIVVNGELAAKFCADAEVSVRGDMCVAREVRHCRVRVGGRLIAPRARIIGGYVHARDGIEAKAIGNEANVRTLILLGTCPFRAAELFEIERIICQMTGVPAPAPGRTRHASLGRAGDRTPHPFEAQPRSPSGLHEPTRKPHVLSTEGGRALAAHEAGPDPAVTVGGGIHPGVAVAIGDRVAIIDRLRPGSVQIVRRRVDGVDEIVVVNRVSGEVAVLPSRRYKSGPPARPTETTPADHA